VTLSKRNLRRLWRARYVITVGQMVRVHWRTNRSIYKVEQVLPRKDANDLILVRREFDRYGNKAKPRHTRWMDAIYLEPVELKGPTT
jgi:hypothetical protein